MSQLTVTARPKTLDSVVGQAKVVAAIKKYAETRTWNALMISGPTGTGKTTLARIIAASLNCPHQNEFGSPCIDCYANRASLGVTELPAAAASNIEKVRDMLAGSSYGAIGETKYRIYILDECQVLSKPAQSLLLGYLESSPETTIFILCTTDPQSIKDTIRGRCVQYVLREFGIDDIEKLVARLLKRSKSELPADRLVQALIDNDVKLPRHITAAVEKYVDGYEPSDAALVKADTSVDAHTLCRAMVKGNWAEVAGMLREGQPADAIGVKVLVISYLRGMLVNSPAVSERNGAIAKSIAQLAAIPGTEDTTLWAALAGELYTLSALFDQYK